jgi:DNA polymerase III subunit delta'
MAADAFTGIRGQDEAVTLLRRAVTSGRVAHAYAFVGPTGAGRKLTAVAFAKALVAGDDVAKAGRIDRGAHPDVRLIAPTPPEKNPKGPLAVRIDDIRQLEHLAGLRPAESPWKVFIVDDADRMTGATPQAFLKTLEEPPAHTVIVLILSRLRGLPPTVLSRCQVVRFRPRQREGSVALFPDGRDERWAPALRALEEARAGGADAILKIGESVGRDRDAAETLVEACWLRYRDAMCLEAGPAPGQSVLAAPPHASPLDVDDALNGLAACREAWYALEGNVSPRLTAEVLLSRLCLSEARP